MSTVGLDLCVRAQPVVELEQQADAPHPHLHRELRAPVARTTPAPRRRSAGRARASPGPRPRGTPAEREGQRAIGERMMRGELCAASDATSSRAIRNAWSTSCSRRARSGDQNSASASCTRRRQAAHRPRQIAAASAWSRSMRSIASSSSATASSSTTAGEYPAARGRARTSRTPADRRAAGLFDRLAECGVRATDVAGAYERLPHAVAQLPCQSLVGVKARRDLDRALVQARRLVVAELRHRATRGNDRESTARAAPPSAAPSR